GYTVSTDGTSHRHVHHGSSHLVYKLPGSNTPVTRTLPITSGVDHTSETQLHWFKTNIQNICDIWKQCPKAAHAPLMSLARLIVKLNGMGSDHAEDQKKLARLKEELKVICQYLVLGEDELLSKTPEEILALIMEKARAEVERAGGVEAYESMSQADQDQRAEEAYKEICQELGEGTFNSLPAEEQERLRLFIWGGCCMHKDDNSTKRGNERMVAWWAEEGIPGPIKLMNRDNAATATLGSDAARKRAEDLSSGGGTKVVQLAGALFNHKDDKKGHQDSWRFHAEDKLGYRINFPDSSNIRFQSHTMGAGELIVNRQIYLDFLDIVAYKKDSPGLNHMEANVLAALKDIPTLTELAVLALYGQAVSHPYMRTVRGDAQDNVNHLDLGPFHETIFAYHMKIIENAELLVGRNASYETASLDGMMWERPEVFYAVQALSSELPHLQGALVAFFKGALETWRRFASEYKENGRIANLTQDQKDNTFIHATNDDNEGALGAFRVKMRRCPNMTLHRYNACAMYKDNDTRDFYQTLDSDDRAFVRRKARELDAGGLERKRRREIAQGEESIARAKKVKVAERNEKAKRINDALDTVAVCLDADMLKASPGTNKELDLQLDWHRRHEQQREPDKTKRVIPPKSKLISKAQKLDALIQAVERYNALPGDQKVPIDDVPTATGTSAATSSSHQLESSPLIIQAASPRGIIAHEVEGDKEDFYISGD
ncbi:hypothetical protein K474DRAFT_1608449, partial [Panus rudis PR-1116 ss-1]